jgi:hypothetical protein
MLPSALRVTGQVALTVLAAAALAFALRIGLVERDDLGSLCPAGQAPWWCGLRLLVVRAFQLNVFGITSIALAVLAAWRRSAVAAYGAVAIGTVGMVLYGFIWSAIGLLGGALVLARLQGQWQQDR